MRRTKTIIPALALCLLQCILLVSSKGIPGYIFTADRVLPNNLLKETPKGTTYNDQDVKSLILHNLGMLDLNSELSNSEQDLISQYGSRSLIRQGKLNYAFFVEGGSSENLADFERKAFGKSNLKHQAALFEVCSGNESKCLLNHLFDTNEGSVITTLKDQSGKQTPEAYFYSGDANTATVFPQSTLATAFDRKGNTFIVDQNSNTQFKISNSLNSCVNNILKDHYVVDLEKGTITSSSSETPIVSAGEDAKNYFHQFMSDICSVVGVSTLIRKDPNPSFFAFHISSLGKLDTLLSQDDSIVLHKIFNIAHEKFVKNVLAHYKGDAVSGQIFVLSPENSLKSADQNTVLLELAPSHFQAARVLAEESATTSAGQTFEGETSVIFRSVFIIFILITAWVCIEMFSMDIQKDSVVYAKFLAADYFRR